MAENEAGKYFEVGLRVGKRVVDSVKALSGADPDEFAHRMTMFFFFCKAFKTYQAIMRLWFSGFQEDAFALGRTLFEIYLQAEYIAVNPGERVKLFIEHDAYSRYLQYLEIKEKEPKWAEAFAKREGELVELEKEYERVKSQFSKHRPWWRKSVKWLADEVGKSASAAPRYYLGFYGEQSALVHTGVTSMKAYFKESGEALAVNCMPSKVAGGLQDSLPAFATEFLLRAAAHANQALGLGLDAEMEAALAALAAVVGT